MSDTTIKNPWVPYRVLLFGLFAMMLILSMNTPAYPSITADLNISSAYIAWMSAAYSLGAAVLAPMMGRLGDLFGMKRILLSGLVLFLAGCYLIGFAPSYPIILVGRLIQGLGVACVMPSCMAFAGRFFPPTEVTKAYSVFGAVCTGGCIFGPTISGLICANLGWRYVYLGGGTLVVVATIIAFIVMPYVPIIQQKRAKFDIVGSVSLFIAVGSVLTLPTVVSQMGASSPIFLVLLVLFVVFLIVFITTERKVEAPLIKLDMFKRKSFTLPAIMFLLFNGFNQAYMYMASYYIAGGLGLSSAITGYWTMFLFIVSTIFAAVVSKLLSSVDWKKLAFIPVVVQIAACGLFATCGRDASILILFVGSGLIGIVSAFNTPLFTASSMDGISNEIRGAASGTFRLIGDLGGPLFVAVFIPLLSTIGRTPEGYPDFAASFPKVSLIMLGVCAVSLIVAFFYPAHDPKADAAK